jgi:hypothetical protein
VYSYPEAAVCAEAVPEFCLPSGVTVRPYTHHSHSTDPLARRLVGPLADMKVGAQWIYTQNSVIIIIFFEGRS